MSIDRWDPFRDMVAIREAMDRWLQQSISGTGQRLSSFRPDAIEHQLAHCERNDVRGAYNKAEYLPERRQMMQQYADTLDALSKGANVIPLRRKKGAGP